ncbi:MAG: hypothetical protein ACYDEQ_02160 [Desulfocucumaceae bacterium]
MAETIVKGKKPVAEHFSISVRQVGNWEKAGMPRLSGRRYDLVQIQLWRDQKKGIPPGAPKGPGAGDPRQGFLTPQRGKDFQEERLKKAKAELVEMEVRQRRGELVEVAEVESMFTARAMAYRQGVMGFTRSLPPQLISCQNEREMEAVLIKAVRELLENVLRSLPEKFKKDGSQDEK